MQRVHQQLIKKLLECKGTRENKKLNKINQAVKTLEHEEFLPGETLSCVICTIKGNENLFFDRKTEPKGVK